MALGLELGDGGIDVLRSPQDDGVEDQAERAELVLHPVAVHLVDGAALAMPHVPGRLVAGLLHGELPVHLPPVGVVHRVDHPQQVLGLGDPPVLRSAKPAASTRTASAPSASDQSPGNLLTGYLFPGVRARTPGP